MNIGNFFTIYLLGNFGDNSWLLWEGLKNKYGLYSNQDLGLYGYVSNSLITEPFIYLPFLYLSYFINPIFLWNLFVILFIFLSFYFSYLFFKKTNSRFDSTLLSLIWISNSYFSFHSREHLSLLAGFLFPIYLLINSENSKKYLYLKYLFLIVSLGISNYIGVFLIFINSVYSIFLYIKNKDKHFLFNLIISMVLCIGLSISLKLYFSDIQRNIDNFKIFSFKPWHFFMQPERAFFNVYDLNKYLSNSNNILFTYFEAEHSTSFFGFTILILFFIVIFKKLKFNFDYLFLLITTLIITLPPVVTIKSIDIYTPSYLFFLLFDQFRVTSRFNIFSFLLILILISYYFKILKNNFKNNLIKILISLTIFVEIFVPYKISYLETNQEIYKYIREKTPSNSQIIIYPYNYSNLVFKDMIYFQRKVINPYGYESKENNFSAKNFTQNISCNEIVKNKINLNNLFLLKFEDTASLDSLNNNYEKIIEEKEVSFYKIICDE